MHHLHDAPPSTEELLVRAAAAGDHAAWSELYRRNASRIWSYVRARAGPDAADDITADVFVRAIAAIEAYAWRGRPFLAWLYRIAHNVTADHLRAAARAASGPLERAPEAPAASLDDRADVRSALQLLTPDQRRVIVLRYFYGLPAADVARALAKPETAVRQLQARALKSLRRRLLAPDELRRSA